MRILLFLLSFLFSTLDADLDEKYCDLLSGNFIFTIEEERSDAAHQIKLPIYYQTARGDRKSGWHYLENLVATYEDCELAITLDSGEKIHYKEEGKRRFTLQKATCNAIIYPETPQPYIGNLHVEMSKNGKEFYLKDYRGYLRKYVRKKGWWKSEYLLKEVIDHNGLITTYYYDKEDRPTLINISSPDTKIFYQYVTFSYGKLEVTITNSENRQQIRWKKNKGLIDSLRTNHHYYQFNYKKNKKQNVYVIDHIFHNDRLDVRVEYSDYAEEEGDVARLFGYNKGVEYCFCRYSYGLNSASMIRFDGFQKRMYINEDGRIERFEEFDSHRKAQMVTYFSYNEMYLVAQSIGNIDGPIEKSTIWCYNSEGYKVSESIIGNITGYDEKPIDLKEKNYPRIATHDVCTTHYEVDSYGRVIKQIEPSGATFENKFLGNTDIIISQIKRDDQRNIITKTLNTYSEHQLKQAQTVEDGELRSQFTTEYLYNDRGLVVEERESYLDRSSNRRIENRKKSIKYDCHNNITNESITARDLGLVSCIDRRWSDKKKLSEKKDDLLRAWEYKDFGLCYSYCDEESGAYEKYSYNRDSLLERKEIYFENKVIDYEEYAYDLFNQVCQIKSKNQKEEQLTFDALHRVIEKRTLVLNETERYSYDLFGRTIEYVNGLGAKTTIKFNLFGSPLKETLPNEFIEEKFYTKSNFLEYSKDNCDREYEYSVDSMGCLCEKRMLFPKERVVEESEYKCGRLVEKKVHGEKDKFYSYNERGQCIERWEGTKHQKMTYNALGEEIIVEEPYVTYLFKRDLKGNILEEKSINHNGDLLSLQTFTFDKRSNLLERTIYSSLEKAHTTTYLYNSLNLQTKMIDPSGAETFYYYDFGQNKCKTTVSPLKVRTIEEYDPSGNLVLMKKEDKERRRLQEVEIEYNCEHEKVYQKCAVILDGKVVDEDIIAWKFDLMGNIEEEVRQNNEDEFVIRFLYNKAGKKERLIKSDGVSIDYEYDYLDQLVMLKSSDGTIDYKIGYNRQGLMESVIDLISHQELKLEYDDMGNKTFEVLPNGLDLSFTYDEYGKRRAMVFPDKSEVRYDYENDRLVRIKRSTALSQYEHRYTQYSLTGQVLRESYYDGCLDVDYEFDHYLRLASVSSKYFHATHVKRDREGRSLEVSGCHEMSFSYTPLGQIKEENEFSYSHDSHYNRCDNSVEHEEFDEGMRLSQKGQKSYFYDALDRLIKISDERSSVQYTYDFFNRMMSRKESGHRANSIDEVYYLYDGMEEIGEYDINKDLKNLRVLGASGKGKAPSAIAIEMEGGVYLPLYDLQGSVRGLFDPQSMSVVSTTDYSAFGEVTAVKGVLFSPWGYKELRVDEASELICYSFRFYDPKRGMFIQPDQHRPHIIFSPYHYCYNDPLNYHEVYGLDAIKDDPYYLSSLADNHNVIYNKYFIHQLDIRNSENISQVFAVRFCTSYNQSRAFLYVNGINTTSRECQNVGINMTHYLMSPVICIHNCPGDGGVTRIFKEMKGVETPPVTLLKETLVNLHQNEVQELYLFCHSEGALITKLALEGVSEEIRQKLEVYSFGALEPIPSTLGKVCHNFYSSSDPIRLLHPKELFFKSKNINITILPSHKNKLFDHFILGETYNTHMVQVMQSIR